MKRIIIVACSLALLLLSACGGNENSALMPFSSSDYQSEYLDNIVAELENAGFTNIIVEEKETPFDSKDGVVCAVTVDGSHLFREHEQHAFDVPIVVTYFVLEEKELVEEVPPEEDASEPEPPAPTVYTADAASVQQLAVDKFGFDYTDLSVVWDDFDLSLIHI